MLYIACQILCAAHEVKLFNTFYQLRLFIACSSVSKPDLPGCT